MKISKNIFQNGIIYWLVVVVITVLSFYSCKKQDDLVNEEQPEKNSVFSSNSDEIPYVEGGDYILGTPK